MQWQLASGKLTINGKLFQHASGKPVTIAVEKEGKLFVLLEPHQSPAVERNVLALNDAGKVIWEIEAVERIGKGRLTFSELRLEEDQLVAYSSLGGDYVIDRKTGRIRAKDPNHRPR